MKYARRRMLLRPRKKVIEIHEVIFRRQSRDNQITLPEQLTQNRLIVSGFRRQHRIMPVPEEIQHRSRIPICDHASVELRVRICQLAAPGTARSIGVSILIMRQGEVETVEEEKDILDVGKYEQITIEIQRSFKPGFRHRQEFRMAGLRWQGPHGVENIRRLRLVRCKVDGNAGIRGAGGPRRANCKLKIFRPSRGKQYPVPGCGRLRIQGFVSPGLGLLPCMHRPDRSRRRPICRASPSRPCSG